MYAPTTTINGMIYVGGASDYQGGTVVDTTNSFSFNPNANTIGTIAAIPRATGETRALNFNGKMLVMGGGRVAPNPSNIVNIYDPGTNTWTTGTPVPSFMTVRRNFPTDTDGTTRIWLAGGYTTPDPPGTPINTMGTIARARQRSARKAFAVNQRFRCSTSWVSMPECNPLRGPDGTSFGARIARGMEAMSVSVPAGGGNSGRTSGWRSP